MAIQRHLLLCRGDDWRYPRQRRQQPGREMLNVADFMERSGLAEADNVANFITGEQQGLNHIHDKAPRNSRLHITPRIELKVEGVYISVSIFTLTDTVVSDRLIPLTGHDAGIFV